MALTYSRGMALGTTAPAFSLPATDGKNYSLESFADAAVLVVVFTCNHCPYAEAAESRLSQLAQEFGPRGVGIVAINPNDASAYPADSFENMKKRAMEKHFPFPYLYDASQGVAHAYDAACTPDIFVFDKERRLTYNGRIDDNWQHPERATQHDLRRAIEATLWGQPLGFASTPSMGCSIKWRK